MKKIENYVVFKYEDEFGFHYMKMDKLPEEGPTYMEPISFKKKINPNCTPGAITQQPFSEDGKSAYVLSSKFVPGSGWWNDKAEVREWQERTRVYKALKGVEEERRGKERTSSLRKPLSLYEKYMPGLTPAGGACLLLRWSISSPSKHFSLKGLKKFQYQGKIDYIWDKQHGQHNDYQSQRIN